MIGIELDGIGRRYPGGVVALDDLTLRVEPGERLAVVGPSGAGKSTLLRLIAGLEPPSSGVLTLGDRPGAALPPDRRGVALVAQSPALFPHWDVARNLAFGIRDRRLARADRDARVAEVAARLGLSGCLNRRPRGLSGGEQKRVALGRALLSEPAVLLLDEPLGSLDPARRADLAGTLAEVLADLPATTLLVTHDVAEAIAFAARLLVLLDGRIAQVGPAGEVYRRPATAAVAAALGDPPCNLLPCRLGPGGVVRVEEGPEVAFPAVRGVPALEAAAAEGRRLLLGFRAEDVRLAPPSPGRSHSLPAQVRRWRPRGRDGLADLSVGGQLVRVLTSANRPVAAGAEVLVCLRPPAVLWFDAESGQRLA